MNFTTIQFLIVLLILASVFFYLPGVVWRQVVLAACNVGFLFLIIPNVASWLLLATFLLSGCIAATLLNRIRSGTVLAFYILMLVVFFCMIRKYEIFAPILPASFLAYNLSIVGLSYMLFRQIQFVVDTYEGQVPEFSIWTYVNYQLNFFALLSGPIQRFQEFQAQWDRLEPVLMDDHAVRLVYFRILLGIVKMTVAAPVFLSLYEAGAVALNAAAATSRDTSCWTVIGRFVELFYSYPVYLYFNFAGYCDIVIAGASLVGVDLPENFDRPYLARNVIDFWTRWHRTLGFWIRDYLFLPLYKGVVENWPEKADSLAFLCYFVAFLVAGIWHGATTNFVIYGLIQAVGVSAAKLWENHLLKSGGRSGLKKYMQSSRMRAVAIVGTLHFECFSLLFFPCDLATTGRMLRTLWSAVI